jgi:hypothetical protein
VGDPSATVTVAKPTPSVGKGWIVSPAYDLFFFANLGWLVLLVPGITQAGTSVDFWLVYYLSLPHRWVTAVLVLTDPDRREGRGLTLIAIATASAIAVVGAFFGTGAFLCLAVVDYVWNAWHFGSQHAGVLRMYARKVGGGLPWLERWGVRAFVTYAAVRAATWASGDLAFDLRSSFLLKITDVAILLIPATLLLTNLIGGDRDRAGKVTYIASFSALYTGIVLSLRFGWPALTLVFIAAAPLYHAVEYLAVVTHYAKRRENVGSEGKFRTVARHWIVFLGIYILILGTAGAWMARPEGGLVLVWQGLNLWMSFVHYTYDGMIWKLRRPATAAALGVSTS